MRYVPGLWVISFRDLMLFQQDQLRKFILGFVDLGPKIMFLNHSWMIQWLISVSHLPTCHLISRRKYISISKFYYIVFFVDVEHSCGCYGVIANNLMYLTPSYHNVQ